MILNLNFNLNLNLSLDFLSFFFFSLFLFSFFFSSFSLRGLTFISFSSFLLSSDADDIEWVEVKDPQSGKTFFANAKTGECAWEKPENVNMYELL